MSEALIFVAYRVNDEEINPLKPLHALLGVARGVQGEPQVIAKRFDPEAKPDENGKLSDVLTANDFHHLEALGFTPERLGLDVVSQAEAKAIDGAEA